MSFLPHQRLILIVGNYGSGKTEVSVNLAMALRDEGYQVQIADLDIVNPYFRCREARELMRSRDIRVVVPRGEQVSADLPIVLPELSGMLRPEEGKVTLFDVGGDDVGAKLLSSFAPVLEKHRVARGGEGGEGGEPTYVLWQVLNAKRPFTNTVEGCLKMRDAIEASSRLNVTGFVGNTHLMDETAPETILEGWELAKRASERSGLPVAFVTAMEGLAQAKELEAVGAPIFELKRYMLPPWLAKQNTNVTSGSGEGEADEGNLPAARPVPIGRPSGVQ